jgi:LmbE family N-acetylglucosaminyl deacetylase
MINPIDSKAFLKRQRLLVVAPHADDETSGAGGLIARIKDAGGEAYVMVVSVGDLDHFVQVKDTAASTQCSSQAQQEVSSLVEESPGWVGASTRQGELAEAMRVLRVDDYEILLKDSDLHLRLETLPRRDLVDLIERKGRLATEKIKPTMICLPAPSYNQDHEAVFRAGITACRPHLATMKSFQSMVLIADAPQLAWNADQNVFKPNFYVDISDFLEVKLKAFSCHRSQLRPDPHQGGLEALRLLAQWRGREISVKAAEAFQCYRFVI